MRESPVTIFLYEFPNNQQKGNAYDIVACENHQHCFQLLRCKYGQNLSFRKMAILLKESEDRLHIIEKRSGKTIEYSLSHK